MHRAGLLSQSQMKGSRCRFRLLDNIVRRTKTYFHSCFFVSLVVRAALPQKSHCLVCTVSACICRLRQFKVPNVIQISSNVKICISLCFQFHETVMRDGSDKNSKVPHCPGIHRAVLTWLLNFAFVHPVSLFAKLSQMRFQLSAEFWDEKAFSCSLVWLISLPNWFQI